MMPPEVVSRHASFFEIEHVVIGNFLHHGRQTYHFSEHLTDRLADTEMNVVADLVTLPFPSAAFVYDCQSARDAAALMSGSPVADGAVVTVYVSMMRIGEEAPSLAMLVVPHEGTHIGSAVSRSLTLKPGSTIEDALKTDWIAENGGSGHEFALPEEHFKTAGLAMARIVVNSALYLASSNPDIVPGIREQLGDLRGTTSKERRKMERALERSTRLDYTAVGRGFRPYDRDGSRSGFKLESRVKVQGHWKMQAHGPGMSLRKIINVEPYWRGPDMAAAVTKPHIVR